MFSGLCDFRSSLRHYFVISFWSARILLSKEQNIEQKGLNKIRANIYTLNKMICPHIWLWCWSPQQNMGTMMLCYFVLLRDFVQWFVQCLFNVPPRDRGTTSKYFVQPFHIWNQAGGIVKTLNKVILFLLWSGLLYPFDDPFRSKWMSSLIKN